MSKPRPHKIDMLGIDDNGRPPLARGYLRVSDIHGRDGKGEGRFMSPQLQLESTRAGALRDGIPFDEEASLANADLDESAFDRPWKARRGILQHYEDALAGKFTHLYFTFLGRLGRDTRESLNLIHEFEQAGIHFRFTEDHVNLDTPDGRFVLAVRLAALQMESEEKRKWATKAGLARARAGGLNGSLPFWLQRDPETGLLSLKEIPTALLRRLVQMRTSGMSYLHMCQVLNREGVPTARGGYRARKEDLREGEPVPDRRDPKGHWSIGHLRRFLTGTGIDNLLGTAFYNVRLPEGHPDRVVIASAYPPVISEQEAAALRAIEEATAGSRFFGGATAGVSRANRRLTSTSYLMATRLVCALCGTKFVTSGARGQKSYICPRGTRDPAAHPEGGVALSAALVHEAVLRVLRFAIAQDTPQPPVEKPGKRAQSALEREKARRAKRSEEIRVERKNLIRLMVAERITEAEFEEESARLAAEAQEIEEAEARESSPALRQSARDILEEAEESGGAAAESTDTERLRQIVLLLVREVTGAVFLPGERYIHQGSRPGPPRRCLQVTLKAPIRLPGEFGGHSVQVFTAPLYTAKFQGERVLYARSIQGDLSRIVVVEAAPTGSRATLAARAAATAGVAGGVAGVSVKKVGPEDCQFLG